MTDDPTKDLTTDEMLRLILNRLTNVESRLGALETQGEDRTKTTRPLLDQLIKEMVQTRETLAERIDALTDRVAAVEKELVGINQQFETFAIDHMKMRSDIRGLNARLAEVEQRPN